MEKNLKYPGVLACTVIACILIWGCPAIESPADGKTAAAKEQPPNHASTAEQWQPAVPFIDTQIPAQFDTATFGLG